MVQMYPLLYALALLAFQQSWAFPTSEQANATGSLPGDRLDLDEAFRFLNYSNVAYCPSAAHAVAFASNLPAIKGMRITEFVTDVEQLTQAFVAYQRSQQLIIVAFRGTIQQFPDFFLDANIFLRPYPEIQPGGPELLVHAGFLQGYTRFIAPYIRGEVQRLRARFPHYKVITLGHSLGGSLATLCAADLHLHGVPIYKSYSFGQPRTGNKAFVEWFNDQVMGVHRFTHKEDIVPHLPPSWLFDYLHLNTEIYQATDNLTFQICPERDSPDCANSQFFTLSIADHLFYMQTPTGSDPCRSACYEVNSEDGNGEDIIDGSFATQVRCDLPYKETATNAILADAQRLGLFAPQLGQGTSFLDWSKQLSRPDLMARIKEFLDLHL